MNHNDIDALSWFIVFLIQINWRREKGIRATFNNGSSFPFGESDESLLKPAKLVQRNLTFYQSHR